ncbi:MAG: hypothetical protein AB7F75_02160 [Planctomycetota bacterium]
MLRPAMVVLLSLILAGCWQDHFLAEARLSRDEWKELKEHESAESQYRYLVTKKLVTAEDLKAPGYGELSRKVRVEMFLSFRPDLNEDDKKLLEAGKYFNGVTTDWIRALYGHPKTTYTTADIETWVYPQYGEFHFQEGVLMGEQRY